MHALILSSFMIGSVVINFLECARKLIQEEALPPMADQFGWCTWDAFYLTVDPPASGRVSPSSPVPACHPGSSSSTTAGRA